MADGVRDMSYFPWNWIPEEDLLVWVDLPYSVARKEAFLDVHLDVSAFQKRVEQWPSDGKDVNLDCRFLVHSSLCGSTLLAKTLDGLGGAWILREPWLLRQMADWRRGLAGSQHVYPAVQDVRVRMTQGLQFLQGYCGPYPMAIKPTNLANLLILDLLDIGFPGRILILTGTLREFLGMALKRADTLAKMPVLARNLIRQSPARSAQGLFANLGDWLTHEGNNDPLLCAGLVWLLHMTEFDGLRRAAISTHQVRTLLTNRLLSNPHESCMLAARQLGITAESGPIRERVEGPTWHTHAKHPEFQFSPDTRKVILSRIVHHHEDQVKRVERCVREWLLEIPGLYLPVEVNSDGTPVPVYELTELA